VCSCFGSIHIFVFLSCSYKVDESLARRDVVAGGSVERVVGEPVEPAGLQRGRPLAQCLELDEQDVALVQEHAVGLAFLVLPGELEAQATLGFCVCADRLFDGGLSHRLETIGFLNARMPKVAASSSTV